jgi:hypothetical protein
VKNVRTVVDWGLPRRGVLCLACVFALLCVPVASAQSMSPSVWITPGFYTFHFDRNRGLRDPNPGLGFEYSFDADVRLTAGRFLNSDNAYSNYLGVYYQPWRFGSVKLGAAVGLFNGYPNAYDGGWFPALLPVASWEGEKLGVNLAIVPEIQNRLYGGVSVQLKYRLR